MSTANIKNCDISTYSARIITERNSKLMLYNIDIHTNRHIHHNDHKSSYNLIQCNPSISILIILKLFGHHAFCVIVNGLQHIDIINSTKCLPIFNYIL